MISVIVPFYNSEKYIKRCIDSILHQTIKDVQVILVNDGSTGRCAEIADAYAKADCRVILVNQRNNGVSSARNKGLFLAVGDWISFIDSDDALEIDMYELLINTAKKYNAEIAHCGYKRLNANGELIKEVSGTHKVQFQSGVDAIPCFLEGVYYVGSLCNKIISKQVIRNIAFDESLKCNEDILFAFQAFQDADRTVFIDETKYLFYVNYTSATNTICSEKKISDVISATKKCLACVRIQILSNF